MPLRKPCYQCYLVTSTIMSVTGLLPTVTEGTPPRKPRYPCYPVTTPIPAITTLLPTVTNHRPARNAHTRRHGDPPPHGPQLDNAALSSCTCMSWRRVSRSTSTHTRGSNLDTIEVHHTAHVNHSVTDRDGTHNHDGVTDRYATRSPVEAPLTRAHIAHDKTIRARSARATRTRLRNVWSTPGGGEGYPRQKRFGRWGFWFSP